MVSADIFVVDDTPAHSGVGGVFVSVVDPGTYIEIASATTDVVGRSAFLLPPGTYEVRAFKMGVRVPNPTAIEIVDRPDIGNSFEIVATVLSLPAATDPRVCRCSGRFVGSGNAPRANILVRVLAKSDTGAQSPRVVDKNMVAQTVCDRHTDASGWVSFDLIRGGDFFVVFAGDDDSAWPIKVPDCPSANLSDLIHPYPVVLGWNQADAPGNTVEVPAGTTKLIRWDLTFSDHSTLTTDAGQWLDVTNGDDSVMSVGYTGSFISVTGVSAGSAEVSVARKPGVTPHRVPDPEILAEPLTVRVVP